MLVSDAGLLELHDYQTVTDFNTLRSLPKACLQHSSRALAQLEFYFMDQSVVQYSPNRQGKPSRYNVVYSMYCAQRPSREGISKPLLLSQDHSFS